MSRTTLIATGSYSTPERGRGRGIALHRLVDDGASVALTETASVDADDASFLLWSADGSLLHAVTETEPARLLTFRGDADGTALEPVGDLELTGSGACHLIFGSMASTIVIAHYGSGQVETVALDRHGIPRETIDVDDHRTYSDGDDDVAPHPHQVVALPGTHLLAVPDLGLDRVFLYRQGTTGMLDLAGEIVVPHGTGPRHLAADHESQQLYVAGELSGELLTVTRGAAEAPRAGAPQVLQGASHQWHVRAADALGDEPTAHPLSHVLLTADEGMLLVADRDPSRLAVFTLDGNRPQLADRVDVGEHPRHFALVGDLVLVAAQNADRIDLLRLRGDRLEQAAEPVSAPSVAVIAPRP